MRTELRAIADGSDGRDQLRQTAIDGAAGVVVLREEAREAFDHEWLARHDRTDLRYVSPRAQNAVIGALEVAFGFLRRRDLYPRPFRHVSPHPRLFTEARIVVCSDIGNRC